jgi:hypothetical protein
MIKQLSWILKIGWTLEVEQETCTAEGCLWATIEQTWKHKSGEQRTIYIDRYI